MGYNLPLNFVKVSNNRSDNKQSDVAICVTRIVAIMSTDIYQARETLKKERIAGTLINAAGVEKARTAIFLDNGSVIASPLTVSRLLTAIHKANEKVNPNKSNKIEVYDVPAYDEDEDDYDDDEEF